MGQGGRQGLQGWRLQQMDVLVFFPHDSLGAFDDILGASRLDGAFTLWPYPVPFITDPVLPSPPQQASPFLGRFSEGQELTRCHYAAFHLAPQHLESGVTLPLQLRGGEPGRATPCAPPAPPTPSNPVPRPSAFWGSSPEELYAEAGDPLRAFPRSGIWRRFWKAKSPLLMPMALLQALALRTVLLQPGRSRLVLAGSPGARFGCTSGQPFPKPRPLPLLCSGFSFSCEESLSGILRVPPGPTRSRCSVCALRASFLSQARVEDTSVEKEELPLLLSFLCLRERDREKLSRAPCGLDPGTLGTKTN